MILDLMILAIYLVIALVSKAERRVTCFVIVGWFALSFVVASLHLKASITFPVYWGLAGIACIALTTRGSALVAIGMAAMFLLQMLMTADALITKELTPLYLNYGLLALALNVVIMFLTFLHGRGLESVSDDISADSADSHNTHSN